jgi:hypothetical protein
MMQERARAIETVREHLLRRMSPRAHMVALVTLTAAGGFLSSFLLLRAGMHSMAIRYPVAVGMAYLVFIGPVARRNDVEAPGSELRVEGRVQAYVGRVRR